MADGRPMGGNAKAFVNIRPVRPGEAEPLYAVWRASVEATHDFLDPDDLEFYARFVREEYLPGARLTVAVDGDGVVVVAAEVAAKVVRRALRGSEHDRLVVGLGSDLAKKTHYPTQI